MTIVIQRQGFVGVLYRTQQNAHIPSEAELSKATLN